MRDGVVWLRAAGCTYSNFARWYFKAAYYLLCLELPFLRVAKCCLLFAVGERGCGGAWLAWYLLRISGSDTGAAIDFGSCDYLPATVAQFVPTSLGSEGPVCYSWFVGPTRTRSPP